MIEKNPFNDGDSLRLKVDNERDRYLTPEETRTLFNACPIHLQQIMECVLYTGMRRKEVLTLKWDQIRDGWIYLADTKTVRGQIPVSDALERLFESIKSSQGPDKGNVVDLKGKPAEMVKSKYVFTYKGKTIKDVKIALQAACKRAGMRYGRHVSNGITFHDLRHSYGSYLQQQIDFRTTQKLMRHKDPKMTQRYTHVSDARRKQAVNGLDWDLY